MNDIDESMAQPPPATKLDFDLHTLATFVVVFDTCNMTEAAHRLSLTQSAVSHLMKKFEERVGAPLFDRGTRPIRPMARARQVIGAARAVLAQSARLTEAISDSRSLLRHMRIGIIDSLSTPFVPHLIRELRKQALSFSISSGPSPGLQRQLLDRDIDILIGSDPFERASSLDRHEILKESFILLVPQGFAKITNIQSLREIALSHSFIRARPDSDLGAHIEGYLKRLRLEIPPTLEFDTVEAILAMVGEGLGWTILPPIVVRKLAPWPASIEPRLLPGPAFGRTLVIAAHQGELGPLPERIAVLSRRILSERVLQPVFSARPWLREVMRVCR